MVWHLCDIWTPVLTFDVCTDNCWDTSQTTNLYVCLTLSPFLHIYVCMHGCMHSCIHNVHTYTCECMKVCLMSRHPSGDLSNMKTHTRCLDTLLDYNWTSMHSDTQIPVSKVSNQPFGHAEDTQASSRHSLSVQTSIHTLTRSSEDMSSVTLRKLTKHLSDGWTHVKHAGTCPNSHHMGRKLSRQLWHIQHMYVSMYVYEYVWCHDNHMNIFRCLNTNQMSRHLSQPVYVCIYVIMHTHAHIYVYICNLYIWLYVCTKYIHS